MEWWGWLLVWIALQPVFAVLWSFLKAPQRWLESQTADTSGDGGTVREVA